MPVFSFSVSRELLAVLNGWESVLLSLLMNEHLFYQLQILGWLLGEAVAGLHSWPAVPSPSPEKNRKHSAVISTLFISVWHHFPLSDPPDWVSSSQAQLGVFECGTAPRMACQISWLKEFWTLGGQLNTANTASGRWPRTREVIFPSIGGSSSAQWSGCFLLAPGRQHPAAVPSWEDYGGCHQWRHWQMNSNIPAGRVSSTVIHMLGFTVSVLWRF